MYHNPSDKCEQWPNDVAWVKRNQDLWIHGRTNFETPPNLLDQAGFITPSDLFYVRQHSEVPRMVPEGGDPDDHTFFVEQVAHDESGEKSVLKTLTFSLGQLKRDFPKTTVTTMLSCSGQRRYEMNLVEQTGGAISWHNSLGNAQFGGVLVRDLLLHLGVSMDHKVSKFVEFHGKEGFKGCVPFRKAMDFYGDCLIAWEMNGEPLLPDHGQPLRAVVPGYSSKCSTKWLTGISVRDKDCEFGKHKAYYKLYPTSMRPGTDEYKQHHQDPEYTIGELNVQSVIFEPHSQTRVCGPGPLKVTGYGHTGGGRPMSRIEVSGNGGKTWEQVRPLNQELNEAGQLWAWVRFEHTLKHFDPNAEDAEVVVRAWDSAANTQPEWPIWNYTGMLNNHLYRVKVVSTDDGMLFVHPAQWMDPKFKPVAADKAEVVHYSEEGATNVEKLSGAWKIGTFDDAIVHLEVVTGDNNKVQSLEKRWGGQQLQGDIVQGPEGQLQITTILCGFALTGNMFEAGGRCLIKWLNGMVWQQI